MRSGEHVSEVLSMLQEDDLWMPRVMARRVENLEVSTARVCYFFYGSLRLTSLSIL